MYCCEVSRPDYLERREGGGYNAEEYEEHPERYISTFATKVTPKSSRSSRVRVIRRYGVLAAGCFTV